HTRSDSVERPFQSSGVSSNLGSSSVRFVDDRLEFSHGVIGDVEEVIRGCDQPLTRVDLYAFSAIAELAPYELAAPVRTVGKATSRLPVFNELVRPLVEVAVTTRLRHRPPASLH